MEPGKPILRMEIPADFNFTVERAANFTVERAATMRCCQTLQQEHTQVDGVTWGSAMGETIFDEFPNRLLDDKLN